MHQVDLCKTISELQPKKLFRPQRKGVRNYLQNPFSQLQTGMFHPPAAVIP